MSILRAASIKSTETAPKPASAPPSPVPAESEYFKTLGGGVSMEEHQRAFLGLTLEVRKALPASAVVVAEFENPQPGAPPLTVVVDRTRQEEPNPRRQQSLAESLRETLVVRSPDLPCVTNERIYRAVVTVYSGASRQTRLATHEQGILFSVPADVLSQMGIPVCGK